MRIQSSGVKIRDFIQNYNVQTCSLHTFGQAVKAPQNISFLGVIFTHLYSCSSISQRLIAHSCMSVHLMAIGSPSSLCSKSIRNRSSPPKPNNPAIPINTYHTVSCTFHFLSSLYYVLLFDLIIIITLQIYPLCLSPSSSSSSKCDRTQAQDN